MSLSYSEVGEILKMIETSSCSEVILELNDMKLVVRKGEHKLSTSELQSILPDKQQTLSQEKNSKKAPPSITPSSKTTLDFTEEINNDKEIVRSPMVGTFYSRPSPEAPPFVKVGQTIKKGETVCLVEVMKLFTAVESTVNGQIDSILVQDGALVEFDQPLFLLSY